MRQACVYILASQRNGTLYIGVTSDLIRRIYEHRLGCVDSFTKQYGVRRLVYYEACPDITSAIHREKQLKKWNRQWKLRLIEKDNPEWDDLYPTLT
ncbi:MAG: GIY-YIG nuclease family protein [Gammaproteobacteria bacterium]|nr:GIY-YIG nuclease family protein [Gammaproteobacteria bacterium]